MTAHPLTSVLVGVCLALSLGGCSNTDVRGPGPTPLLGNVQSRIKPDEARHLLGAEGKWRVLDEGAGAPGDRQPPAKMLRVWIEPHSDLGSEGAVMLRFFNDELASVTFFPNDMAKYLTTLREQRGIDLTQQSEVRLPPGTTVVRGVNATKQAYVSWDDTTLVAAIRKATS